jgi:hypothetical protein
MNQNYGTTGIKHAVAMLLMMALEDENHQHLNIDYISSPATPPEVSVGAEAMAARLDSGGRPQGLRTNRQLVNGGLAVPAGLSIAFLFRTPPKTSA